MARRMLKQTAEAGADHDSPQATEGTATDHMSANCLVESKIKTTNSIDRQPTSNHNPA